MNKQKWNQQRGGANAQPIIAPTAAQLRDQLTEATNKGDAANFFQNILNISANTTDSSDKIKFHICKMFKKLFGISSGEDLVNHAVVFVQMYSVVEKMTSQRQELFYEAVENLQDVDGKLLSQGLSNELKNELAMLQANIFIRQTVVGDDDGTIPSDLNDVLINKIKLVNEILTSKLTKPATELATEPATEPATASGTASGTASARKYYNHQVGQGINDIYYKEKYLKYKAKYTNLKRH